MKKFVNVAHTVDELIDILNNYNGYSIDFLGGELSLGVEVYVDDDLKTICLG